VLEVLGLLAKLQALILLESLFRPSCYYSSGEPLRLLESLGLRQRYLAGSATSMGSVIGAGSVVPAGIGVRLDCIVSGGGAGSVTGSVVA